jgi:hypothetical protein
MFRQLGCTPIVIRFGREKTMTFVSSPRRLLQISLQDYGELILAQRVSLLGDSEMSKIREIARRHMAALGVRVAPKGPSDRLTRKLEKAQALAAVEVMEGASRPLKRQRRLGKRRFT